MAENETLDVNVSPRLQRVCRAFQQSEQEAQMEERLRRYFYSFIRQSLKNIADKGVSLEELLRAACGSAGDLHDVLRRSRQHDFARLLADNAEPDISHTELLQRTMNGLWDRVVDQLALEVVPCPMWPNFPDLNDRLDQLRSGVQPDLQRIANRLAEDAEWEPRVPPRRGVATQVEAPLFGDLSSGDATAAPADAATEATRAFLGESLLNRRPGP